MNSGFYAATMGVLAMQQGMDITANNIANTSTDGYKQLRASFADLIYTERNKEKLDVQTGHGVKVAKTDLMFDISSLRNTGKELDFAIPSEGFFAVLKKNGEVGYTRNGNFAISQMEDGTYQLCDTAGYKVLSKEGQPITIQFNDDSSINTEAVKNNIGVYKFSNPYGLRPQGDNIYDATPSSGEATVDINADLLDNFLENSSTNLAEQMVNVIQYQRAFSLNSKMVQTSDEIEQIVNNLR